MCFVPKKAFQFRHLFIDVLIRSRTRSRSGVIALNDLAAFAFNKGFVGNLVHGMYALRVTVEAGKGETRGTCTEISMPAAGLRWCISASFKPEGSATCAALTGS